MFIDEIFYILTNSLVQLFFIKSETFFPLPFELMFWEAKFSGQVFFDQRFHFSIVATEQEAVLRFLENRINVSFSESVHQVFRQLSWPHVFGMIEPPRHY